MSCHQRTWKRRLYASFGLTILLSGGIVTTTEAQAPSGITTSNVSNGYPLPRAKQGVQDLETYIPGDPVSERRFQAFDAIGIGLSRQDYWWPGLEQPGSKSPRVITSRAVFPTGPGPHCPSGYILYPTSEAERVTLGFKRFHCYNSGTIAAMDTRMTKEFASGIQSAATLLGTPLMHEHPNCTIGFCVPYDATGLDDWEDYINFIASRYNGLTGHGKMHHYIIWNEVDEAIFFSMEGMTNPYTAALINQNAPGPISALDKQYWTEYVGTMMKRAHAAIKRHTSGVMLYVCLTGLWEQQYRYGGKIQIANRDIVDRLWIDLGVSYDWSIALHPYLDPDNDNMAIHVNFAEIQSIVVAYQQTKLNALVPGANPVSYPQTRVLASEQGWPKTDITDHTGVTVLLPGVGVEGQAANICKAHQHVMASPYIIGSIHNNFQENDIPGVEHANNIALVPVGAGKALDGLRNINGVFSEDSLASSPLRAYYATGPARFNQSDAHFCCVNYNKGCKNALQSSYSVAGSGKSELPSFNGDALADYAEQYQNGSPYNDFYIHLNTGSGNFDPVSWGSPGLARATADYEVLLADFTGDGWADFANVRKSTGQFWLHRNINQAFDAWNAPYAYGVIYGGPNVEYFTGDFDGDGRADVASRNVKTGYLSIVRNVGYLHKPSPSGPYLMNFQDWALNAGPTATHPNWRTLIADMNGDNRADFLDQWLPDGRVWRHLNDPANAGTAIFGPGLEMNFGIVGGVNPTAGASWTTVFGDWDGNGWADFGDLLNINNGIGYFWKHLNLGTSFGPDYGPRIDTNGAPNWRMIGAKN
jgi:hypothetical protein